MVQKCKKSCGPLFNQIPFWTKYSTKYQRTTYSNSALKRYIKVDIKIHYEKIVIFAETSRGKSWDRVLGVTFKKKTYLIFEFSVFLAIKWYMKQCIYITQNEFILKNKITFFFEVLNFLINSR